MRPNVANPVKEARFLNLKMKTPGASSPSKTGSPSYIRFS